MIPENLWCGTSQTAFARRRAKASFGDRLMSAQAFAVQSLKRKALNYLIGIERFMALRRIL